LPNDRSQCPAIKLFVIGHYNLSKWIVAPQDNVAASLPFKIKARFLQGFHTIRS